MTSEKLNMKMVEKIFSTTSENNGRLVNLINEHQLLDHVLSINPAIALGLMEYLMTYHRWIPSDNLKVQEKFNKVINHLDMKGVDSSEFDLRRERFRFECKILLIEEKHGKSAAMLFKLSNGNISPEVFFLTSQTLVLSPEHRQ